MEYYKKEMRFPGVPKWIQKYFSTGENTRTTFFVQKSALPRLFSSIKRRKQHPPEYFHFTVETADFKLLK